MRRLRNIFRKDNSFRVRPLEERDARDILRWRYREPYDFYDPPDDDRHEHYIRLFLSPELKFHAVVDRNDEFIGFCSFGLDGQVPGGDYSEDALDIGLGMKPELTGQGRGNAFFNTILQYAQDNLSSGRIRLTVAKFNERALRLYMSFGFVESDAFIDSVFEVPYTILVMDPG